MNFDQFLERNSLNDQSFRSLPDEFEEETQPSIPLDARLFMAHSVAESQGLDSFHDLVIEHMTDDAEWRRADRRIGRALEDFQLYMAGCYRNTIPAPLSNQQKQILELLVAYEVLHLNLVYLRDSIESWKQLNPDITADLLAILFPPSLISGEDECST